MLHSASRICRLFLLVMLLGCSSFSPERAVVPDNVFTSNKSPDINIGIGQNFEYIGKVTSKKNKKFRSHPGGASASFESHIFGEVEGNNNLKRLVLIRILKINNGYWLSDHFSDVKHMLETGETSVEGVNYQYAVFPDTMPFIDYEELFLFDSGYMIPSCFIVKALARREGLNKKNKYYVAYLEAAYSILDGKYRCQDWMNVSTLESDQKEYLSQLSETYHQCIKIGCDTPAGTE